MTSEPIDPIVKRIRAELERDTRVNLHESQIALVSDGGVLRLDGEVPDLPSKRIAANVCRQLAGSRLRVEDHLCVATTAAGDRELAQRIGARFVNERAFANTTLEIRSDGTRSVLQQPPLADQSVLIDANDGIVELSGDAASLSHRRLAEVLCWWTTGCRRVDNRLQVTPRQDDFDGVLNDAVHLVLEVDPLLDAGQLHTAATAGIVEIDGIFPTAEAHMLALRDIWAVPGVFDVYDRSHVELS